MTKPSFFFYLFFISLSSYAQQPGNFQTEAVLLRNIILKNHYQPRSINNAFSTKVYNNILETLDPDRIYFTQQDLLTLTTFTTKIDDEIDGHGWLFLPTLTQTYRKSLQRCETIINQLALMPLDIKSKEIVSDDTTWCNGDREISKRWQQLLAVETLEVLADMREAHAQDEDADFFKKYEPVARQKAARKKLRHIHRILNSPDGYENFVASAFLASIAGAFDAHTDYFSKTAYENLVSQLSTQGYYFGIDLDENDQEEIIISEMMPGGAAWKSGQVHAGDQIVQLQWEGKEPVVVEDAELNEVSEMLSETNHSTLEIKIKTTENQTRSVKLKKEKAQTEENIVKGFVLQGERKIGYISLPGFYTDWDEGNGTSCANDVAKEIIKLKGEGIEGLVLDVRYNGGGSLQEAVDMTGIFIDAGPVAALKNKEGLITTMKDIRRGAVYDGPMALMVNSLSASASEFLAAALQDYRRAIVIGSKTYGKATAQNVLALDPSATKANTKQANFGTASVTIAKIYRITGKTAQQLGVTPDVVLPDVLSHLPIHERDQPMALPSDSIMKKMYYQPLPLLPLKELNAKSQARCATTNKLKGIEQYALWLERVQNEDEPTSLNWLDFKKQYDHVANEFTMLQAGLHQPVNAFKVTTHAFDQHLMDIDDHIKDLNAAWIENLQHDVLLEEAFLILTDAININTKK